MLPEWNPENIATRIPGINVALVGGRRMGKSTATADLLWRNASRFDLVLCFVGSAYCNPVLEALLERFWDPRFFFAEWNAPLIRKLLEQQESLEKKRSILIIIDDVVLSSKAQDQLCTLAMRGRHFGISLMMACVSYTTLPKRVRRSLDCVLVFSLPMKGDLKVLTWEYTSNTRVAEFALRRLEDHQCLVLETLTKKQKLTVWRATTFSAAQVRRGSPFCARLKTRASAVTSSECQPGFRPNDTFSASDNRKSQEDCERAGVRTEDADPSAPLESDPVDPE